MTIQKLHGILLKIIKLANDDALLEFFTAEKGRVVVGAPKFLRSKKKQPEVDFFRLLEINCVEKSGHKKLREVQTIAVFHHFNDSYENLEKGFEWLEKIRENCFEEKESPNLFRDIVEVMGHVAGSDLTREDAFIRIKLLCFQGVFPRFDTLRGDIYFDPINLGFSGEKKAAWIFIPNITRQVIEFLRRSGGATFLEKRQDLPLECFEVIIAVLKGMERRVA